MKNISRTFTDDSGYCSSVCGNRSSHSNIFLRTRFARIAILLVSYSLVPIAFADGYNNLLFPGFNQGTLTSYSSRNDSSTTLSEVSYFQIDSPVKNDDPFSSYSSVRLDFTQKLAGRTMHYSSYLGDKPHFQLGTSWGNSTVSFFSGEGEDFAKTQNAYQDVDPYYFHGGHNIDFSFSGMNVGHSITEGTDLHFGSVNVEASGLTDRQAHYIGVSTEHLQNRFTMLERGGETVGRAIDTSVFIGRYSIDYQDLSNIYGGSIRKVSFQWQGNHNDAWSFGIQNASNPLIEDGDDNRYMVSYSRLFGKQSKRFHAAGGDTSQAEKEQKRNKTGMLIGAGAVAVAVIGSSGSGDKDSTPRFNTQHKAARHVLNNVNPKSVAENREYGGWIYRSPDGTYSPTATVTGTNSSVLIPLSLIPGGVQRTALFHTHAAFDPRYDNENFSPTDLRTIDYFLVDGYLATPAGRFLWAERRKRLIHSLGTVAN
jgi:hypothetical protein